MPHTDTAARRPRQTPLAALPRRLPLAPKLLYLAWFVVWFTSYRMHYGMQNFLWLCDVSCILLLFALWLESALLLSALACGVLLVQIVWCMDFAVALLAGIHPVGGTEYMFDATLPLWLRALSLFHAAMPPLLLWGLARTGYHRAGWMLQTLIAWVVLPLTWLATDPALNINWLWRPFGVEQQLVPQALVFPLMMLAYPLVLFYPTHLVLSRIPALRGRYPD